MIRKCVAEFLGTFALVFAATGAIVADVMFPGNIGHLGVSLVFGLIIMIMILAFGNVSGAHFNPAVSIAFWISGRFKRKNLLPYIASQFLGAIGGSMLLLLLFQDSETFGETVPEIGLWRTAVVEIVLTFFLMLVIMMVSTGYQESGPSAALAIGGYVAVAALFAGPWTGASMNPARTLGPALASGYYQAIAIYMLAPVVGAALSVPICKLIKGPDCCGPESESDD